MEEIDVSIIVVTYNTKELIAWCLDKLLPNLQHLKHEVIVVDNGSVDDSSSFIQSKYPTVKLITTKKNLGFGGGNNLGLKQAKGRYIVLLNSDAYIHPGCLEKAVIWMDTHPDTGAAGARLISEDGSWQPYARQFPSFLNDFLTLSGIASKFPNSKFLSGIDTPWYKGEAPLEVDWVTGAFMIFPKTVLDQVGHFDQLFYLYYEEVDLCRRIKEAGYKIWALPEVVVTHLGGMTCKKSNKTMQYELTSGLLYYRKHHGSLGARGYKLLALNWHRLRYWKNRMFSTPEKTRKAAESQEIIDSIKNAWKQTRGGNISPPIPW